MLRHRASVRVAGLLFLAIASPAAASEQAALPRLVDLGAGKCIPCKKMAPILKEMEKDYAGVVDIVFIDVWKDPKAGKPYKIRVIPTQVFYDIAGKEVFRHEGFFSREEIEKVFREKLGVKTIPKEQDDGGTRAGSPSIPREGEAWVEGGVEGRGFVSVGEIPESPPLLIQIVHSSIACACVLERCERQGRLLHEILDPRGADIAQIWIDRAEEPERADEVLDAWGLGYLPAIALLDSGGRPYYADDEEIDLDALVALLGESF